MADAVAAVTASSRAVVTAASAAAVSGDTGTTADITVSALLTAVMAVSVREASSSAVVCALLRATEAGLVLARRASRFISIAIRLVTLGSMPPVGSWMAAACPGWIWPRPSAG